MRIALCDDEKAENVHLFSLISAYAARMDYDIVCSTFTTGRDLLKADKFDLYILDYKMGEMDGVEVAQALKEKFDQAVTVCFLTNYESAASEIINHQVYADGFLKKPVEPDLLFEKLERFYRSSSQQRFELRRGKGFQTVYAKDIFYVEADGKRSILHYADREESFNYLISQLESEILTSSSFFRIHRSYIVNLEYVASYDSRTVTLKNGTALPLKARNFKSIYRDYLFRD